MALLVKKSCQTSKQTKAGSSPGAHAFAFGFRARAAHGVGALRSGIKEKTHDRKIVAATDRPGRARRGHGAAIPGRAAAPPAHRSQMFDRPTGMAIEFGSPVRALLHGELKHLLGVALSAMTPMDAPAGTRVLVYRDDGAVLDRAQLQ